MGLETRIIKHYKAEKTSDIEDYILKLNFTRQRGVDIINILHQGSYWHIWHYIDIDDLQKIPQENKSSKKRTNKK